MDNIDSTAEAVGSLANLRTQRLALAERAIAVPWYAPLYGLLCGLAVASGSAPLSWSWPGLLTSSVGLAVLYRTWMNMTGVSVNGYRRGQTRTIAIGMGFTFAALTIGAAVLRLRHGFAWAPVAGGIIGALVGFLGSRAWDRAWLKQLKAEL